MFKELLKKEVKRLSKKLKKLKKLYKEIDEYSGELYDKAMVSSLEITELKKEICELQKSVDVLRSERPKNYGVTRIEPSRKEVMYLRVRSEGEAVAWTLLRGDALRMTKDRAAEFIEKDGMYTLFKFPTYEELEAELAELKLDSIHLVQLFLSHRLELEAELAELKLDSIPNDDIIEIDKTEQYGTAVGETCNRPCKGKIVKHSNGKINYYNCMDYL